MSGSGRRNLVPALMLGSILILALFLIIRPLQLESPASSRARSMIRLDGALGATVEQVGPTLGKRAGLPEGEGFFVVTSLAENGPAMTAGLRVGDVIERIAGKPATDFSGSLTSAPVLVWREGQVSTVVVHFFDRAESAPKGRL